MLVTSIAGQWKSQNASDEPLIQTLLLILSHAISQVSGPS